MMSKIFIHPLSGLLLMSFSLLFSACSQQLPSDFTQSDALPKIYPDYVDVTVPVNIAPLSFEMDGQWEEMAVRYAFGDEEIVCRGDKAQPDIDDWKSRQGQGNTSRNLCPSSRSVDSFQTL